jgi:hypothetical protein
MPSIKCNLRIFKLSWNIAVRNGTLSTTGFKLHYCLLLRSPGSRLRLILRQLVNNCFNKEDTKQQLQSTLFQKEHLRMSIVSEK